VMVVGWWGGGVGGVVMAGKAAEWRRKTNT